MLAASRVGHARTHARTRTHAHTHAHTHTHTHKHTHRAPAAVHMLLCVCKQLCGCLHGLGHTRHMVQGPAVLSRLSSACVLSPRYHLITATRQVASACAAQHRRLEAILCLPARCSASLGTWNLQAQEIVERRSLRSNDVQAQLGSRPKQVQAAPTRCPGLGPG